MKLQTPKNFNKVEHDTWKRLFNNLESSRFEQAHPVFKKGVETLEINADKIPDVRDVNAILKKRTGWQGVMVEGLEENEDFFTGLRDRVFPIGNFIRDADDISYTPEPDIFHDLYGHLPWLADEEMADFMHRFGVESCKYLDNPDALMKFGRLFWFAVEFPLIQTKVGKRIFGGGILSSYGECNYCLSDKPNVLPFDVNVIREKDYRIDIMQEDIFILDSPEQLYGCLDEFTSGL